MHSVLHPVGCRLTKQSLEEDTMTIRQFSARLAATTALLAALTLPAAALEVLKSGTFEGGSGHSTSGTVQIIEDGGKMFIRLGKDFLQDGSAPDVTIALGKDGYDDATNLGKVASFKGAQDYELPAGIKVADYNQVYIWCKKFAVPLGLAALK